MGQEVLINYCKKVEKTIFSDLSIFPGRVGWHEVGTEGGHCVGTGGDWFPSCGFIVGLALEWVVGTVAWSLIGVGAFSGSHSFHTLASSFFSLVFLNPKPLLSNIAGQLPLPLGPHCHSQRLARCAL